MALKPHQDGFTLIELLVTLAIAAILLVAAAPNFSRLMTQNRITTQANHLLGALQLARSEAITRGVPVVIHNINDSWQHGWNIFVDNDNDEDHSLNGTSQDCSDTTKDCLLRTHGTSTNTSISATNIGDFILFNPDGSSMTDSGPTNGTITLCPPPNQGQKITQKQIIINRSGSSRIQALSTVCP